MIPNENFTGADRFDARERDASERDRREEAALTRADEREDEEDAERFDGME